MPEFFRDVVIVNVGYSSYIPLSAYPENLYRLLESTLIPNLWLFVILGLLGLCVAVLRGRGESALWWFAPGWLVAAFAEACAGGYFRGHYFIPATMPFSLLVGFFVERVTRRIGVRAARAAVCAALVAMPLVLKMRPLLFYSPDEVSRFLYGSNPFVEAKAVAEAVRRETMEGDRVFIFGSEPEILFYARRKSATRYILTYPLMMDIPGALQRQMEVFQEVRANTPAVIVVVDVVDSHLAGPWSNPYLLKMTRQLVEQDYQRIYPLGSLEAGSRAVRAYKRKGPSDAAAPAGPH